MSCTTLVAADDLVRRVALEVEAGGGPRDGEIEGPDMHAAQHAGNVAVVEVYAQSAELGELGELPQNDGRYRPSGARQQPAFRRPECVSKGEDENVGVKI